MDIPNMDNTNCTSCHKKADLNTQGRCRECQDAYDATADVFKTTHMDLDNLISAVEDAAGIDDVMDVLTRAIPPQDKLEQQHTRERLLRALRKKVSSPSKIVDAWLGSRDEDNGSLVSTQASELVKLVQDRDATLFHAPDQTAYASLGVDGHREVLAIRSRSFKLWASRAYWEHTAAQSAAPSEPGSLGELFGPRVPSAQAITDACATLEGMAIFDGEKFDVHVRVAHVGQCVYLDLGNEKWEAVEITATGWRIVPNPPVMFRRPPGLEAPPNPEPGGSITDLRPFLNVNDDEWALVVGYVVGMFSPGPYPVAVLLGEQGTAKSTVSKVLRRLIDPNTALLRRKPRSDHDLAIAANNGWVVVADNLSTVPVWLSDAICTLATGGGFATRQLYSDADEQLFDSMRPVILNGIGDIVARSDLLDRSILLNLPVIGHKIRERDFWANYDQALPKILGAVLDAVAMAISRVDEVELDETPRMVDFAAWVTAAEEALGLHPGAFLAAYLSNRASADQTALDASPIGRFIVELIETDGEWTGTATDLLSLLNEMANTVDKVHDTDKVGPTRRQEGWPKAANALSGKLKLLAPNLRRVGVDVAMGRDKRSSIVTLTATVPRDEKDLHHRHHLHHEGADVDGGGGVDDLPTLSGSDGGHNGETYQDALDLLPEPTTERIAGNEGKP